MQTITIIVSAVAGIISGMVLYFLQKYFRKKEMTDIEKDKVVAKENILVLKSLNALGKLTQANSIALKRGVTNGEMQEALEKYEEVDKELYDYLLERNAHK